MNNPELAERLEKLELRCAWQDEQIEALSGVLARLQETIDLQQAQLRFLYGRLPESVLAEEANRDERLNADIPPHY